MNTKLEDLYEPIGKLVVRFQNLEIFVGFLLIDLLKQDYDTGFCLTSEMSFTRLVAAFVTISESRIKDATLLEEIQNLAGQLNICEAGRNKVIHSHFTATSDGKTIRLKITAKQRYGLKKSLYDTSVQEINEHIKQIEDATKKISSMASKLIAQGIISSGLFR